jgi:ATP synthase subunit a
MKSMLIITLVLAIIIIILGLLIHRVDPKKKTPLWLVPIVWIVSIINNFTKTNIGKRWKTYAPYFLTVAIYLFVLNISAIFCQTTPTTYIVINFAFGVTTFFIIQITGIVSLGFGGYLKSFVGPVWWLAFLFIPINIISEIALPLSLTLRLTGNLLSGSVISKLIIGSAKWFAIPFMPFINGYFDLMSGVIQTFVFIMLTIIFTSMKIDDSEKIYD